MAVKKSELYSTLWSSCDELRGGMEPTEYKDYVLLLLFVRYVSDKAKIDKNISIPKGSSFDDFVTFKGKKDIGEKINIAIRSLAKENNLEGAFDGTDFNDESKLGKGQDLVDTLTKLIGIFENPNLNFASNRADGDDILGDAYEYLMQKFSKEAGKSKGEFYTPAEVSTILASIIGVEKATSNKQTIYDPTCGSGSLLLKTHEMALTATGKNLTIYGQEFKAQTASLAKMNMWLHGAETADIRVGNTIASPQFTDKDGNLRTFDFAVANPPFSDKKWRNSLGDPKNDVYKRFIYGIPPDKKGDFAFLQHMVASLKDSGSGAIIMPHGVLFRGNADELIRKNLVEKGIIKAIVGLPANLFYGTGIPACILVLDKSYSGSNRDIFMIDASKGFIKDGNKNRLRERDIHAIVHAFKNQSTINKFSRVVKYSEIEQNGFNLNIPRYIDSSVPADIQDIEAHLKGGIPNIDFDALENYWNEFPTLRKEIIKKNSRDGYSEITVSTTEINKTVSSNSNVIAFKEKIHKEFDAWKSKAIKEFESIDSKTRPKLFVQNIAQEILNCFEDSKLVDNYSVYQGLMEYWDQTLKDDIYLIIERGWAGSATPIKLEAKSSDSVDFQVKKDKFHSETLPREVIISAFLKKEQIEVDKFQSELDVIVEEINNYYEDNSGDDDLLSEYFNTKRRIVKKDLKVALKEEDQDMETLAKLKEYEELLIKEDKAKRNLKSATESLSTNLIENYRKLNDQMAKGLIINKWITAIEKSISSELDRVIRVFVKRLIELEVRYETPLPVIEKRREELSKKVHGHLISMGFYDA